MTWKSGGGDWGFRLEQFSEGRTNDLSTCRPPTLLYTGAESSETNNCALLHPTFLSDLRASLSDASPAAET